MNNNHFYKNSGTPKIHLKYKNELHPALGGFTKIKGSGDSSVPPIKREVSQLNISTKMETDYNTCLNKADRTTSMYIASMKLYHKLFNVDIYREAYLKLQSKAAGCSILNEFSELKINAIIESMKNRSFKFKPLRYVEINNPNGGSVRRVSVVSSVDKIVQEALRLLIGFFYENRFLDSSHGFRPFRDCHSALKKVQKWVSIKWCIQGGLKGFFDNIDPHLLVNLLKRNIKDQNVIDLYWKLVKAGYVNQSSLGTRHSLSGAPYGVGLISLLSNIYLHELDLFMEKVKQEYNKNPNLSRKPPSFSCFNNPQILKFKIKLAKVRLRINREFYNSVGFIKTKIEMGKIKQLLKKATFNLNSSAFFFCKVDQVQVNYVRYADDYLIGIKGDKKITVEIKDRIKNYLRGSLNLILSDDNLKITQLSKKKATFLGVELKTVVVKRTRMTQDEKKNKLREASGFIQFYAPVTTLLETLIQKNFAKKVKKSSLIKTVKSLKINKIKYIKIPLNKLKIVPCANPKWLWLAEINLLRRYESIFCGLRNYYYFVVNRSQLSKIAYMLKYSLICTLSRKLRLTTAKIIKKFGF